jgi:Sulfotransferase family
VVERLKKQKPTEGSRRAVLPATAVFHRLLRQEAGKLRYLSPASRPAGMSFGRFFSSAHISIGRRFIYVKNDKVGSSFVIRSLTGSEKRAERIRYRTPFLDPRRNPLLTPAELSRRQWTEALSSFFIFTFCRNPFSRILSCYLDRIVGRDESYFVLKKRIGAAGDFAPSFPQFLEILGEPGVLDLDTHWKPQHRNIAVDYYPYRFIGHFEDFATEFPALLAWLYGGNEKLGEVRPGTSATSQLAAYYDDHAMRLVRDLYRRDFDLFGYDDTAPHDMRPKQRNVLDFINQPVAGTETG